MNSFHTQTTRYRACRPTPDRRAYSLHRIQAPTHTLSSVGRVCSNTRLASASQSPTSLQLVDAPAAADVVHMHDEHVTADDQSVRETQPARPRYRFRNPYKKHTRRPHTPEERAAKSARMKGRTLSEETKERMRQAALGRKLSIATRVKQSDAKTGRTLSEETRAKMSAKKKLYYENKRRQEQAAHAEAMKTRAPSAMDLGLVPTSMTVRNAAADALAVERAVTELVEVRREVVEWMNQYEREHGRKPLMQDAAKESPALYNKLMRYVALRDFVRNSNL